MSQVVLKPAQLFVPDVSRETGPQTQRAIKQLASIVQQHEQAFVLLKQQQATSTSKTAATSGTSSATTPTQAASSAISLGHVNNQEGTAYLVQDSDYGSLITLANNDPVALSLNTACRQYWFGAVQNLGPGLATVTTPSGQINNGDTLTIETGTSAWLFFDGVNWWAATSVQLPKNGVSGTAPLAALTPTGKQGTLTFVAGIITGYTAPS